MFQAAFSRALPAPRPVRLNAVLWPASSGHVAFTPPAHHAFITGISVTPFVYAISPGTTRNAHTPPGLPCPGCAPPSPRLLGTTARSYLGHSHQSAAFETPADDAGTGYHSGSHTSCAVIPVLHYSSHVGWTSVRPDLPGMSDPRLPPRHSCRCATTHRFRGPEYRSCTPIRPGQAFADSAPSLLWFTGKGLMPLSSLSFSRSAFVGRTPEVVSLRLVSVATTRLPTPACVKRTCRAFHPNGHVWLWSESRRGICDAAWHHSPALDKTDLPHCSGRRVPLAHIQLAYPFMG
jgi:hypothetical protein